MTGQTIGHYVIGARLGSGGMGVVYEAEDRRLGRRVAIKFLPDESPSDAQAVARFLREARAISSLNHPHICTLHDIGEHGGQHYMVMELLEGEPAGARMSRGPIPIDDVLQYGEQVADALDVAHANGIVHRDIKPGNLFITRRGQMKVLDFGVAKLTPSTRSASAETIALSDQLTSLGSAIGTIHYMSPEQARGQDIDGRSDIFSLGAVLYEMATGRAAFPGTTPAVVFEGILGKAPQPPSELVNGIPAEFDRIVLRALEKDRDVRYQSAADLRAELKRLRKATETGRTLAASGVPTGAGGSPAAPVAGSSSRPRRLAWLLAAPVVTAAVVAGVVLWRSAQTPALTSRDTVVLTAFTNRTGDAMFDDTLSEALAMQLRQSPFLNVLNEQQQQATLRQMGRDPMSSVTTEIGREICQRNGGRALLGGSIAALGRSYLLTLNAHDCVTGDVLAEEQAQAGSKDDVLSALGDATRRYREKLGESLASIQRYDAKIEEATTPSLDALKAYSQAIVIRRTQGDFEAVPLLERAIQLDPDFALAYARLGTVFSNIRRPEEAAKMTTRAYELRDRVSEHERLYIEARYHTAVSEDVGRAIETYRVLIATFPNDYAAHTNLGALLKDRGELSEAIASLKESVRLAPEQPTGWLNLGYTYLALRQLDDARESFTTAINVVDSATARAGLYTLAIISNDDALAEAQVQALAGRRDEMDLLPVRAQAAAYRGRMRESAELTEAWKRYLEQSGRGVWAAEGYLGLAIGEALVGLSDQARSRLRTLKAAGPIPDGSADERLVLAAILTDGADARAALPAALAEARESPDQAARQEPALRALAAMAAGQPDEAVRLLAPMSFTPQNAQNVALWALANERAGQADEALRALEWLTRPDATIQISSTRAHLLVSLARRQAAAGRIDAARTSYEQFFDLWKSADEDVPLLIDARKEYATLGS